MVESAGVDIMIFNEIDSAEDTRLFCILDGIVTAAVHLIPVVVAVMSFI